MRPETAKPLHPLHCPDWRHGFDTSCASFPEDGIWFLKRDAIGSVGRLAGLDPDWIETLCVSAERFAEDRTDAQMLWHWHRGLVDPGGWSVSDTALWPIAQEPKLASAYALLVLSGVQKLCDAFSARAIDESVTRDTLRDVYRAIQKSLEGLGCVGVMKVRWLTHHLTHRIIELGRLQFEIGRVGTKLDESEREALRINPGPLAVHGMALDTPVLWVHIPNAGPMTPQLCDASFAIAQSFFADHFPEHKPAAILCRSWLMDRQLADHLPASSNIVRFLSRFEQLPIEHDSDEIQQLRVRPNLRRPRPGPQRTGLERAIVRHFHAGGRWRVGLGKLTV
ncbi:MAG: acyltransferase domain-containing protein [Phycisphaerales bacterium]